MSHVATLGLEPAAIPAAPTAASPFTRAYTRYAMGLLLAIYIVNFLDRQVVNILAEPIKNDLGLADWELGLMSGLAFAVFYTFLGIPIARLAERRHRPIIIGASVVAWSGFTALCGAAQNFTQLVACRIGVGVGEAGCTPPAHSLIVDYVPKEKRASALAFYSMGTPLGGLVGMIMGGLVADAYGWRAAFLVAGAPGILFALLVLTTLEEPRRLMGRHAAQVKAATTSFGETLKGLTHKPTFWFIAFAAAIKAFIGYGHAPFTASFFMRNHFDEIAGLARQAGSVFGFDMGPVGFLGLALGLIVGVGGATGSWLGGWLADKFGSQGPARLHGGPGNRQPSHHPDLHHRRHRRQRGAWHTDARRQRAPGYHLVRAGLRHRPVDRSAAHARHHSGDPALHHQPDRPGSRPAGRWPPLRLVQP